MTMAGKFFWIALGMFSAFSGGVQAQSDTLRVLFAGDIMQHEAQLVTAQRIEVLGVQEQPLLV